MRLSEFPYVVVRIACSKCPRQGRYRLARLADRYGAETTMPAVLAQLAGDCKQRDTRLRVANFCGAYFVDMNGQPPDAPEPPPLQLRVVK